MENEEMLDLIAEQLINEFPDVKTRDIIGKAKRLYNIMKLEKSLEEIQRERVINDFKKNVKYEKISSDFI